MVVYMFKKITDKLVFVLLLTLIFNCTSFYVLAEERAWKQLYVNQNGSDDNSGTEEAPFKTVQRAIDEAKYISPDMHGDIIIHISEGIHFQNDIWEFDVENSGKNGHSIVFEGAGAEKTVISGGKRVSGFEQWDENPEIYRTKIDGVSAVREISVNGEMRYRAKGEKMYKGVLAPEEQRNLDFYTANKNAPKDPYNFYDVNTWYLYDGFYMSKNDIGFWKNPEDIEFTWIVEWIPHIMHVSSIDPVSGDDGIVRIRMNPFFNFMRTQNSNNNAGTPEKYFEISNAIELLDSPGEFYYDKSDTYLYYMPYEHENMSDADVIVAVQDRIMCVIGDDIDKKVENITFRDMSFAHYTSDVFDITGGSNGQGMSWHYANGRLSHSAIYIERAKNINFYSNHFYGLDFACIHMINAVEDCEIIGNVFSEIGDMGIIIGSAGHQASDLSEGEHSTTPPKGNYYTHLIDSETPVKVSFNEQARYHGWWNSARALAYFRDSAPHYNETDRSWYVPELDNENYVTWFGDPKAKEKGINQWARFDFKKRQRIDKIVLGYRLWETTDENRSNFEILLSNDRNFGEGNYVVAHRQTEPLKKEFNEIELNVHGKYRFMMIRTITPSAIGISRIFALTKDVEPYVRFERCKNIKINNNYFKDIGVTSYNGAIAELVERNIEITHNEIDGAGYSGITSGWNWGNTAYSHFDANVSYNRINDINKVLADGAGIYTLGRSVGSKYTNNYVSNSNLAYGAYYTDQGTSSTQWYDNVGTNTSRVWHIWINTVIDNIFKRTYSSTSVYNYNGGKNDFEKPVVFVNGDPTEAVYNIMKKAGLEEKYKNIKAWVKNDTDFKYAWDYYTFYPHVSKRMGAEIMGDAENIIGSTNIGYGFGQHTPEYVHEVKDAVEEYNSSDETDKVSAYFKIKYLLRDADKRFTRLEPKKMLEFCRSELENHSDRFDEKDIESFKAKLDELTKIYNSGNYKENKYKFQIELEKSYNEFNSRRKANHIAYVYAENSYNCDINYDEKTVILTFPENEDLSEKQLSIYTMPYSELATVPEKKYNLENPVKAAVYSENTKIYEEWTIKATKDSHKEDFNIRPDDFITDSKSPSAVIKLNNGIDVKLHTDNYPAMAQSYSLSKDGGSIKFKPVQNSVEGGEFTFIFGAPCCKGLSLSSKNKKSNRFEAVFSKTSAKLYQIENGERKLIKTSDYKLDFDKVSQLTYKLAAAGENTHIVININGEQIFNDVSALSDIGKYFGFFSDNTDMRVYG